MGLDFQVRELIKSEDDTSYSLKDLKKLVSVIDLTSLNPNDNDQSIKLLTQKTTTALGNVAAICVYPEFLPLVVKNLPSPKVKIATVVNFPTGTEKLEDVLKQIKSSLKSGANEIDVVFPFAIHVKQPEEALAYIAECKKVCGKNIMKVILEISEFHHLEEVYKTSLNVIACGADFLKTSTGKSKHGATLESASAILIAIKSSGKKGVGFKASGGIKEISEALAYIRLAKKIMGERWVKPAHFRIGASGLLDNILAAKL